MDQKKKKAFQQIVLDTHPLVKISSMWFTEQITNHKIYKIPRRRHRRKYRWLGGNDFLGVTFRYKGIIHGKNNWLAGLIKIIAYHNENQIHNFKMWKLHFKELYWNIIYTPYPIHFCVIL